jgi:hypothetical protein
MHLFQQGKSVQIVHVGNDIVAAAATPGLNGIVFLRQTYGFRSKAEVCVVPLSNDAENRLALDRPMKLCDTKCNRNFGNGCSLTVARIKSPDGLCALIAHPDGIIEKIEIPFTDQNG